MQASTIVADEPLTLTVRMSNNMALPITLSRLRLACSHSSCSEGAELSEYVQVLEFEPVAVNAAAADVALCD